MTFTISKRGAVRAVSFLTAALLVLSFSAYSWYREAKHSQQALSYHYLQGMNDLTVHLQNLGTSLEKTRYANTAPMLASLSAKLWREAGLAKVALDSLPIPYSELQNTNKLLSQVGDYCVTLSREFERGSQMTGEQRKNLEQLQEYCDSMLSEVLAVDDAVRTGSLPLTASGGLEASASPSVTDGFTAFEAGFTSYPTLIYDGPFSDHIMEREPTMLKGAAAVSRAQAKKTAALASGISEAKLSDGNDEEGKMPSYAFASEGTDISITKKGGYLCYLLKSRTVEAAKLSWGEALKKASAFLESMGFSNMKSTYYETAGGKLTANFAYSAGDVLCYTDLIKVTVALDSGEITGCDARGFLVNHRDREALVPALTEAKAAASVSGALTHGTGKLCLIPTGGLDEVLCWEFSCQTEDRQTVLVYINAQTGIEEQILILLTSESGQLTI